MTIKKMVLTHPSPKQMGIINKMPKLANGSAPPQADTSFNHGANVTQNLQE